MRNLFKIWRFHKKWVKDIMWIYTCEQYPLEYSDFVFIKALSLSIYLYMKEKGKTAPLYLPDKKDLYNMYEYSNADLGEDDELREELWESIMNVIYTQCEYGMCQMFQLMDYGWENCGNTEQTYNGTHLVYCSNDEDTVSEKLSKYQNFFDEFFSSMSPYDRKNLDMYIFRNERLGKVLNFAKENHLESVLIAEIKTILSRLMRCWGNMEPLYCLSENYLEVVFVSVTDENDFFPSDGIEAGITADILLPVYALNLEKLLDRAYKLYPIGQGGD